MIRKLGLVVRTKRGFELMYASHGADLGDFVPVAVVEGALCDGTFCLWCRKLKERVDGNREY